MYSEDFLRLLVRSMVNLGNIHPEDDDSTGDPESLLGIKFGGLHDRGVLSPSTDLVTITNDDSMIWLEIEVSSESHSQDELVLALLAKLTLLVSSRLRWMGPTPVYRSLELIHAWIYSIPLIIIDVAVYINQYWFELIIYIYIYISWFGHFLFQYMEIKCYLFKWFAFRVNYLKAILFSCYTGTHGRYRAPAPVPSCYNTCIIESYPSWLPLTLD